MTRSKAPAIELHLPWPDRRLHPNARVHWAKKGEAAREARHMAKLLTLEAGWHRLQWPEGRLHLWLTFQPPNLSRRRDDDGLLASMKPARDGIADAIGIDDHRFVSHPFLSDETHPGGRVVVRITGAPAMPAVVPLETLPLKPTRSKR